MKDKAMLKVVERCFLAFRNQFEKEKLDSDDEVTVQKLVIARIDLDAEMGMGELESEAPKFANVSKKQIKKLTPDIENI